MDKASAPVTTWKFSEILHAAGIVESPDRISEIRIIARPQELVVIEVTYLADQRILSLADGKTGDV